MVVVAAAGKLQAAGLGAAAEYEVPLTFRQQALRITFLTAHKVKDAEAVDWSALTDVKMTVVVYMGVSTAPAIQIWFAGFAAAAVLANTAMTPTGYAR